MDLSNSMNLTYFGLGSQVLGNYIIGMQYLTRLKELSLSVILKGTHLDANYISHLKI
jgi:hypothetical protein